MQVIGEAMGNMDILGLTRLIRECVGCQYATCFPIVEFVEIALPEISGVNYEYCSENELPGEYAHYDPNINTIKIRQDVYCRAANQNGRDRFTIAHEVGHSLLHANGVKFSRVSDKKIPIFQDVEWQANTFASFLLMEPRIICGMTQDLIATECKTSHSAAKVALNKISQAPNLTY